MPLSGPWSLRAALAVAAFYAVINAVIRLAGGTRLAMDDAKTNLFTQTWQWGYQADNPPLYEWLIGALHPVTGGGLASFLILNALCLIGAAGFTHLAVRRVADERAAFGTAMGLVLLYQVGWNFHQAFTHSALLLTMVCAGLWTGLRLVQRAGWFDYVLFGAVLGLGMMAKYNFALLALGFVGAAVTTRTTRKAILSPRFAVSLALAALILAPHGAWLLSRADVYAGTLPDTLSMTGSWPSRVAQGLLSLAVAVGSFFLPWAFVYAWLRRRGRDASLPQQVILLRTSLISVGAVALGILFFGIGAVSERYVIPVLLPAYAGLTATLLVGRSTALRRYLLACLGTALAFSTVRLAGFAWPAPPFCEDCRVFVPYGALERALAETVPAKSILLAREENTAGNLVAAFPKARVTSLNLLTQYNPATPADAKRPCYYVWSEDMTGGVPLFDVFAFAYDDPRTVMVDAPWRHPLRDPGFRRTVWGITPLEGALYDRFCAADAPG